MRRICLIVSCILFICIFSFPEIKAQGYEYKTKGFKIQMGDKDIDVKSLTSKNSQRRVIKLKKLDNENVYRVRLTIGKVVPVDCNGGGVHGEFRKDTIDGTIPCFIYEPKPFFKTQRGCLKPPEYIFKTTVQIIEYNSKYPLVIYFPKEYKLKHSVFEYKGESVPNKE